MPDRDIKKDKACEGVTLPVQTMGAYAAVMGLHFYTGNMFPAEYKNAMFIPRKGSWNRTKKIGFDVVTVRADADGKNPKVTPFVTGFLDEKSDAFWGRPAYILQMPDGSLLLSDEQLALCSACHGAQGNSQIPLPPRWPDSPRFFLKTSWC